MRLGGVDQAKALRSFFWLRNGELVGTDVERGLCLLIDSRLG